MLKRIKRYIYGKYLHENWNVGFISTGVHEALQCDSWNIIWLKHPYKDRFFADPFILEITEKNIILLVEEFYYPEYKGRIAKLTIDKEHFTLLDRTTVLSLDTHLSFPAIFRYNHEIYLYPENSASGKLWLFRYDAEQNRALPVSVLCDHPLIDAVLTVQFGEPVLFTTLLSSPDSDSELCIYRSDRWDGTYRLYQTLPIDKKIARNGGAIFEYEGMILRPAQNCNGGYGKGLIFQQILFENGVFSCGEYKRSYPTSKQYNQGLHTFNFLGDKNIIAVDGYDLPLCNRIVMGLYGVKEKLLKHRRKN